MIDKLLKLDRKLYHTQDLALLWNIDNKNTLYTAIARYVKKGILIAIHKGFYSTVPIDRLDPNLIGASYLHSFSYVSTETVLANHGVIAQIPQVITFISSVSKKFTISNNRYLARKMKLKFLLNYTGIEEKDTVFIATLERAVFDMLYFNPKYFFDNSKLIHWDHVKKLQREIGFI